MNSTSYRKTTSLRSRLLRYLILPAAIFGFAMPAADARPGRDRGHPHHHRGGSSAGHHHGHHHHAGRHAHGHHRHHSHHRHVHHAPHYRHHVYHAPRHITVLPRGYRTVYRSGIPYYYVNGCYYRPHYHNNARVFVQFHF